MQCVMHEAVTCSFVGPGAR